MTKKFLVSGNEKSWLFLLEEQVYTNLYHLLVLKQLSVVYLLASWATLDPTDTGGEIQ